MEISECNVTQDEDSDVTFQSLGIVDTLCEACTELNWKTPTAIQKQAIPEALQGRDIIGLAETGSGKTAAFALPVLQALLKTPQRLFALVLTPTRELAFQIAEQFEALGAAIGIKTAVVVGGIDMATQSLTLSKKPHIIIATPGRLVDHLENTKGFSLRALKFLILDEADRILDMDFELEVDKILKAIPKERNTYLYSATMTQKVQKLERASLNNPVKVEVSKKYQTVEKLEQYYIFLPDKYKDVYLVHILNELPGESVMVFCDTCVHTQHTAFLLRNLGFTAIPLHGKLSQAKRLGALQKFKAKTRSILIATDVASRGLDIPHVDVVINFDIPSHPKDYIHRVGRTVELGAMENPLRLLLSKYILPQYGKIEALIGKELPEYPTVKDEVMVLVDRVKEAQLLATKEMNELENKSRKRKYQNNDNDDSLRDNKSGKKKFKKKFKQK